ncbi:MAG: translocation/assembly module TamB domain-containing protein [Ancalomicrobiaceae bacterium]|nr:translocation/assembly module TamB domain-containing protein [Ancalomicrobiaceae bacterium]
MAAFHLRSPALAARPEHRRNRAWIALIVLGLAVVAATIAGLLPGVMARADDASDKSWLVSWVEETISTPDRKITLGRIDGALSSDVHIDRITVADRQGVWLTIDGAHLIWSRTALFKGTLAIDRLEATAITVARLPAGSAQPSPTASQPLAVPKLPVAIVLKALDVPSIRLAAAVAGSDMAFAVSASGTFDGDGLKAHVDARRTDAAASRFRFDVDYAAPKATLGLDLDYQEPSGGLIAHALGLPGAPALRVTLKGSGPLANYAADLALQADGRPLLSGRTTIARQADGFAIASALDGSLESLASGAGLDYFTGRSTLSLAMRRMADGALELDRLKLASGVVSLDAQGHLSPDGFPTRLVIDGALAANGRRVHLPGSPATIGNARFSLRFGDGAWTSEMTVADLADAAVTARALSLRAAGGASDLADAAKRAMTFAIDGSADGMSAGDPGLADAIAGGTLFHLAGSWRAAAAVDIEEARASLGPDRIEASGSIDGATVSGRARLVASDLHRYARLVGTPLSGGADLTATGHLATLTGAFEVAIAGGTTSLQAGTGAVAALLRGETHLAGTLARDTTGTRLSGLKLQNDRIALAGDGEATAKTIDLTASARLTDVKVLTDRASGPVAARLRLLGPIDAAAVTADVAGSRLQLGSHVLETARLSLAGVGGTTHFTGDLTLAGALDAAPLDGHAKLAIGEDGSKSLTGLKLTLRRSDIRGDLTIAADGPMEGSLTAHIPDLAEVAPLLLIDARGAVDAEAQVSRAGPRQDARLGLHISNLAVEGQTIGTADAQVSVGDLTGTPAATGTATIRSARLGRVDIAEAGLTFAPVPAGGTLFTADARLGTGPVHLAATLTPDATGFDLTLAEARATIKGRAFSLQRPALIQKRGDSLKLATATLQLPQSGTVVVSGEFGSTLAADIALKQVPLALADLASADLGAAGTLTGTIHLAGARADPQLRFLLNGEKLTVAQARSAGLSPFAVRAEGSGDLGRLTLSARISDGKTTNLATTGSLSLDGSELALVLKGTSTLALVNPLLRERGTKADGRIEADLTISGRASAPSARGRITLTSGSLADPQSGMRLSALSARIGLDGDRISIEQASAKTGTTGTIAASGNVRMTEGIPADVTIRLTGAQISAAPIAQATIDGAISVKGPLMRRPTVSGTLTIQRAEISIPERFAANVAALNVRSVKAPAAVKRTEALAFRRAKERKSRSTSADVALNVTISVPARLFVRGRGVDAELGGTLHLAGTLAAPQPTGALDLRRGSLDVAGKHVKFDSGSVTLLGDLNPMLDFKMSSTSNSTTVTIAISGNASDPTLVLSSTPELPQDEILSQFLFGHNVSELSSTQLLQLASAAAQLAGGSSGPGLLSSIRASTGLDSFGTTTDRNGNVALQAGRYIGEHIYLGVVTGRKGSTDATVNIDIGKNLKVQVEAGQEENKASLLFQKEY